MTYLADTTGKQTHRVGYYLALDGIPTRFATHRFDELVKPTTSTAHAWWPINETTNSASIVDALGNYDLTATGVGTPDPAPSFLQPTTAATGSRHFTADYDLRFVNSGSLASEVIERGSVSAGFRPDTVTGTESIFAYSGDLSTGDTTQNPIVLLRHSGSEIQVIWRDSGASDIISTTSGAGLTIGVPYHVLVTWKTSGTTDLNVYLWQVGSGLVHEQSFTGLAAPFGGSAADFVVGSARHQLTAQSYNGYLEDVVLWKIHHSRDKALAYLNLFSASFEPALDLSGISASGSSLDRGRSLVIPGGFSARVMDGATQRHILSRRGGDEDVIDGSISRTATDIDVVTANNPSGGVAYLERETVLIGTVSGFTFENCQRGAWGSQPIAHGGGMVLSSRPRHMMGRRGSLVSVDLETYNAQTLRAGILSSSPQFSEGAYDLEFVDVQKELNRPLMRGWLPQKSSDWSVVGYNVDVVVPDSLNFVDGARSFVRVDGPDLLRVHTLATGTVTTGTHTVRLDLASIRYDDSVEDLRVPSDAELELRQVTIITQDPATAALQVMLSTLGDGANHATYDVLPGRRPSATAPIRQVGAGIPSDWVDVATWEGLQGVGGLCTFYLEEETRLLDFLINEICWRLGGYIYVTDDGKISFQRYVADTPAVSSATIAKADILAGSVSVVDDESETVGRVSIECNYHPGQREFRAQHQVVFADLNGTYGDDLASVELQSKSLWIGSGGGSLNSPPTGQWEIISSFDRMYSRTKDGVRKVRFQLPWKQHLTVKPGYVFQFTDDRLPDFAGGEGISQRTHEVTAANPDPQSGSLEVEAEEIPRGYLVAPSALVTSYDAGTGVITIDTSTDFHGTEPGFDFMLGATIRVFDASASPPFSTSQLGTVISLTANTIGTGGFASSPASGDLIVLEYSTPTGNTAANTGAEAPDHLFHGNARSTLA